MMGGIRAGLRPISTSHITINTFSNTVKGIVSSLLRPTSTSCTITPTISYLKFVYTQQSTMVTWVMGGIVDGMGPISNSPITTNSFSYIVKVKVDGFFRPISTSTTIKSYVHPLFAIIITSISPPIVIIRTCITLLFFVNLFLYTMTIYW